MKSGNIEAQRRLTFFYAAGLYLLALAILLPHAGHQDGRSFLKIALDSDWNHWWDWAAIWCSFKVILFTVAAVVLTSSCGMWLELFHRRWAAKIFFVLAAICALGFWAGAFLLVKAIF